MPRSNTAAKTPVDKHPTLMAARRAIQRTLPQLTPVQLMRLAATAETLAYGESRGRWELSLEWAGQRETAQPYQQGLGESPTREHIALMLNRLEIIDLEKWMAVEQLLGDVLRDAEDKHRRRFHRSKPGASVEGGA